MFSFSRFIPTVTPEIFPAVPVEARDAYGKETATTAMTQDAIMDKRLKALYHREMRTRRNPKLTYSAAYCD